MSTKPLVSESPRRSTHARIGLPPTRSARICLPLTPTTPLSSAPRLESTAPFAVEPFSIERRIPFSILFPLLDQFA